MSEPAPRTTFIREVAGPAPPAAPIPLTKPCFVGNELAYIQQAVAQGNTAGDGQFSDRCCQILRQRFGLNEVLLVSSGATALDLAAALCDLGPDSEVIMPSYTFVATANAFVRCGAKPVFVDVDANTLNLDPQRVEAAITPRTRAIVPVHYAGVGCEMDALGAIAKRHSLLLIEDAAQGVNAFYRGRPLGSFGDLSVYSFHEAKNFAAGQAGALCINRPDLVERAEILRDKGTNRRKFFRGEAACYEWVDIGVGHALSEINAAVLCAQLEQMDAISTRRAEQFERYRAGLAPLAQAGRFRLPYVPAHCQTNCHIFYLLLSDPAEREALIRHGRERGVALPFHYAPLHASPMGRRFGYRVGDLPVTEDLAARLVRLPLYHELSESDQARVLSAIAEFFARPRPTVAG